MPQMAPLNWISLFMYFIFLFLMLSALMYFIIFYKKTNMNKKNIKKINWKW